MATPERFCNLALPYSYLEHTIIPFLFFFRQLRYLVNLYNFKQMMFFSSGEGSIVNQKYMYNPPTVGIRQYNLMTFLYLLSIYKYSSIISQHLTQLPGASSPRKSVGWNQSMTTVTNAADAVLTFSECME